MTPSPSDDTWKTAQLRAAEADLLAAVERGRRTLAQAQRFKAQIRQSRVCDDDIRLLDEAARAHDAPRALRQLAQRVDDGELTWRQIVDGKVMDDPGVRAAFEPNLDKLAQVYRKFEEGYSLEDVLESETARRPGRGREPDDERGDGTVLRHSSW